MKQSYEEKLRSLIKANNHRIEIIIEDGNEKTMEKLIKICENHNISLENQIKMIEGEKNE